MNEGGDEAFAGPLAPFFSPAARLQGMLDFEAGLARSEAALGVIPAAAGESIAAACRASQFDLARLADEAREAGNPAIPMVTHLTARIAERDAEAARYVHWGATSQDAIDTGLVLQTRRAGEQLAGTLASVGETLADMADRHKATPMVARTLLQHALPTSFGYKCALWLAQLERQRAGLERALAETCVLQLGGAAGTRAALAGRGAEVARELGRQLDLAVPETPWHTSRDRWLELTGALARLGAGLAKTAQDITLLMQTEVGEVFEARATGRGGSSSLPHKRNPVFATRVLTAARQMPGRQADLLHAASQEHERGLGNWHAECELIPQMMTLAGRAGEAARQMLTGLEVDPGRMRANIEATRGQIFAEAVAGALAPEMGRAAAHELVASLCQTAASQGRHLRELLGEDETAAGILDRDTMEALFDPAGYTGEAEAFVDRVLQARKGG